jgi:hypothetical protein
MYVLVKLCALWQGLCQLKNVVTLIIVAVLSRLHVLRGITSLLQDTSSEQ